MNAEYMNVNDAKAADLRFGRLDGRESDADVDARRSRNGETEEREMNAHPQRYRFARTDA
jgi:hypothetical protein